MSHFTQEHEHGGRQKSFVRQREFEVGLLIDFEKTLYRDMASLKMKLANVDVLDASHQRGRGNVANKVRAWD